MATGLGTSDFTYMTSLDVTIGGQGFEHLLYHFVLTYSNWESVTICFSESFESLSEGFQNAVWELGGVPQRHRKDRMVCQTEAIPAATDVTVEAMDLSSFDDLFLHKEVWDGFHGGCEGTSDGLLAGTALADVSGVF